MKKRTVFIIFFAVILFTLLFSFCTTTTDSGMVDFKVDTREKGIYSESSKYALIVGISEFTDDWITDLVYADNDADNFYQTLAVHNQYSKENITMLKDSEAVKGAIITGLINLAGKANNKNDLLIFMYSGHGVSIGGESYILPVDAKIAKEDNIAEQIKKGDLLRDTLISVTELKEAVGESIANRVFFLDACRTNVVSDEKGGAVIAEVERLNNEDIDIDDVVIISATQQGMPSYESSTYMASYMSYSLNDGLRGDADMDKSGFISIEELSGYMYKRVEELCLEEGRDGSQELSIMNVGVDSDIFLGFSMFGWDGGSTGGLDLQVMEQDELNTIIAGTTEFPEKKLNTFNECYTVFTDAEKMLSDESYEEAQQLYDNVVELVAQTPYKMEGDENFESLYDISVSKSEAITEYFEDLAEQEQKRGEMEQITSSFNKAVESYNAANTLDEYLVARDFILEAVGVIYSSPYKDENDYVRSLAQLQEWLEEIDKWVLAKASYAGNTAVVGEVLSLDVNLQRPWYQAKRESFGVELELFEELSIKGFIFVKGGTFSMGSNRGDDDEEPVHSVTVGSFYMSKYEVTFEQYDEFCEATGRDKLDDEGWGRNARPVINVSWYDAVEFCNWLSEKEGLTPVYRGSGDNISSNFDANGYRLPTEAEWEYAARGGNNNDGYEYSGTNTAGDVSWYSGNSSSETHPVGGKSPNSLGLYDMSGNVREWCWDWYGSDYYSNTTLVDPKGPDSGSYRVLRGGSWGNATNYLRCADRNRYYPVDTFNSNGFRVVVSSSSF